MALAHQCLSLSASILMAELCLFKLFSTNLVTWKAILAMQHEGTMWISFLAVWWSSFNFIHHCMLDATGIMVFKLASYLLSWSNSSWWGWWTHQFIQEDIKQWKSCQINQYCTAGGRNKKSTTTSRWVYGVLLPSQQGREVALSFIFFFKQMKSSIKRFLLRVWSWQWISTPSSKQNIQNHHYTCFGVGDFPPWKGHHGS